MYDVTKAMKIRPSVVFWLFSLAVLAIATALSASWLPERVATHFGASGRADGWMPRGEWITSFLLASVGIPAFTLGILFAVRYFPPSLLNVPHADYWRSPGHYPEACRFLFFHAFWFAGLQTLWFAGVQLLTLEANRAVPAALDPLKAGVLTAALLAGIVVWPVAIYRYFARPLPQG